MTNPWRDLMDQLLYEAWRPNSGPKCGNCGEFGHHSCEKNFPLPATQASARRARLDKGKRA